MELSGGTAIDSLSAVVDAAPDIAFLTGQGDSKLSYATALLGAGIPCVIDKQMAMNHEQCTRMLSIAEDTGTPLLYLYPYRHRPSWRRLTKFLAEHDLGPLKHATLTFDTYPIPDEWIYQPEASAGGGWFAHGDHAIDWMHLLFDDSVAEVRADMFYDQADRLEWGGVASYRLTGGAVCLLMSHAGGSRDPLVRRTELNAIYEGGSVRYFDDFFPTSRDQRIRVHYLADGQWTLDEWRATNADFDIETFELNVAACIDAVNSGEISSAVTGSIAARVHAVADATYAAARSGGTVSLGQY